MLRSLVGSEMCIRDRGYIDWFNVESDNIHQQMYEIASKGVTAGGAEHRIKTRDIIQKSNLLSPNQIANDIAITAKHISSIKPNSYMNITCIIAD